MLMFFSCTKSSTNSSNTNANNSTSTTTTASKSTFTFTFNGKTYNYNSDNTAFSTYVTDRGNNKWTAGIQFISPDFHGGVYGVKYNSTSATGVYHFAADVNHNVVNDGGNLTDYNNGSRLYVSEDTTSTLTIEIGTKTHIKGTFSVNYYYNHVAYPATGVFDVYK